jgi:hypothetical protein
MHGEGGFTVMANPATRQQLLPSVMPLPNWSAYAGILPPAVLRATKDFFMYTAAFLPLAAGAVNTQVATQIQADSDFLIIGASRIVTDTAAPPVVVAAPVITIQINDSGSGRNLLDAATHIDNVVGTAANPFYWPYPKLVKRTSTLTTILTNLDAANARNVRIAYYGFKLFGSF